MESPGPPSCHCLVFIGNFYFSLMPLLAWEINWFRLAADRHSFFYGFCVGFKYDILPSIIEFLLWFMRWSLMFLFIVLISAPLGRGGVWFHCLISSFVTFDFLQPFFLHHESMLCRILKPSELLLWPCDGFFLATLRRNPRLLLHHWLCSAAPHPLFHRCPRGGGSGRWYSQHLKLVRTWVMCYGYCNLKTWMNQDVITIASRNKTPENRYLHTLFSVNRKKMTVPVVEVL